MIKSRSVLAVLAFAAAGAAHAFDANGVALGSSEAEVKKAFPSALCKPLEWASRAADRRCDDGKIAFGGAEARITFYLRKGAIQAFDVRFDNKDLESVGAFVKSRYGKPLAEATEKIERQGKPAREVYKARWEKGADHAVLVSQKEKKRATLTVSRGDFDEEIYRVR
jgi:hypothetical protein